MLSKRKYNKTKLNNFESHNIKQEYEEDEDGVVHLGPWEYSADAPTSDPPHPYTNPNLSAKVSPYPLTFILSNT